MTKGRMTAAWSEDFVTGVPALDEQHQALFRCVVELEQAAGERTMLSTCHALAQLSRYAREHFADEERLMREHGYPGIDSHIAAHRDFSHRLFELRRAYLDEDISSELIALLRAWLRFHVTTTDMDYVPYLRDIGHTRAEVAECRAAAR